MQGPAIWLMVALGGAVGAMARFGLGKAVFHLTGPGFPWGTLAANVFGSLAMGLLIAWLTAKEPQGEGIRAFLAVGVLGAFTTFSTFALEAVLLFERKEYLAAGGYVGGSVAAAIAALMVGLMIGRSLFERTL